MTDTNGLTNPFENAIESLNYTQVEKQKRLDEYSEAIRAGYEPPQETLDGINAILNGGVLDDDALAALEALIDEIMEEISPIITSNGGEDSAIIQFDENSTSVVTTVTAIDRYTLNDQTASLIFSISGADAEFFSINSETGELRFVAPPDYEGNRQTFELVVQVNDGTSLIDTQAITVNINDVNEAPTIAGPVVVTPVSEDDPSFVVDLLTGADDPDTNDILSIANLVLEAGDASGVSVNVNSLSIDPTAYNALSVGQSVEITYSYDIVDGNGGSVGQTASITINGVNDNPFLLGDGSPAATFGSQFLIGPDGDTFDASETRNAAVVKVGEVYSLYYSGLANSNSFNIGLATSQDGENWARYLNAPIIPLSEAASWSSFRQEAATVLYEDGLYKMWFWGNTTNLVSDSANISGFGYAESIDGKNWNVTQEPIRVQQGSFEIARITEVVKVGSKYIGFYEDYDTNLDVSVIRIESTDGVNFTSDTLVTIDFEGTVEAVYRNEIIGDGFNIMAATSFDGGVLAVVQKLEGGSVAGYYAATSTDGFHFNTRNLLDLPQPFTPRDITIDGSEVTFWGVETIFTGLLSVKADLDDLLGQAKPNLVLSEDDPSAVLNLLEGADDPDVNDVLSVANITLTGGDDSGISLVGNSLIIDPSAYNSLIAGEREVVSYSYDIVDGNGGSVAQTASVTILGADDVPVKRVLFFDDFNRPDGQVLGNGWIEGNEVLDANTGVILQDGRYLGASFLEIDTNSLEIEYVQPDGGPTPDQQWSRMYTPHMTQNLGTDLVDSGFGFSLSVSPDQWEALNFFVGLAAFADGWSTTNFFQEDPTNAFGIFLGRTSTLYQDSIVQLVSYSGGVRTNLDSFTLPFQFEDEGTYEIGFEVDPSGDYQISVKRDAFEFLTSGSVQLPTAQLDAFVLHNQQSGLGFSNPNDTLIVTYDDIEVYTYTELDLI